MSARSVPDPPVPDGPSGPARRTTPDTYESLVAAARDSFARGGYDATSIRAITSAAGANLGAVTYHFGSKRALYDEVLRRVMDPLKARIDAALARPGSAIDRLSAVVEAAFEQLHENPDQPFLILQEIAAGKPPPAPVLTVLRSTLHRVMGVVSDGQRRGDIRQGDPFLIVLSLLAQPVYMSLATRALRGVPGRDMADESFRRAMVRHALGFARGGLTPSPPTERRPG